MKFFWSVVGLMLPTLMAMASGRGGHVSFLKPLSPQQLQQRRELLMQGLLSTKGRSGHGCNAVVLHPRFLLTAAHCVTSRGAVLTPSALQFFPIMRDEKQQVRVSRATSLSIERIFVTQQWRTLAKKIWESKKVLQGYGDIDLRLGPTFVEQDFALLRLSASYLLGEYPKLGETRKQLEHQVPLGFITALDAYKALSRRIRALGTKSVLELKARYAGILPFRGWKIFQDSRRDKLRFFLSANGKSFVTNGSANAGISGSGVFAKTPGRPILLGTLGQTYYTSKAKYTLSRGVSLNREVISYLKQWGLDEGEEEGLSPREEEFSLQKTLLEMDHPTKEAPELYLNYKFNAKTYPSTLLSWLEQRVSTLSLFKHFENFEQGRRFYEQEFVPHYAFAPPPLGKSFEQVITTPLLRWDRLKQKALKKRCHLRQGFEQVIESAAKQYCFDSFAEFAPYCRFSRAPEDDLDVVLERDRMRRHWRKDTQRTDKLRQHAIAFFVKKRPVLAKACCQGEQRCLEHMMGLSFSTKERDQKTKHRGAIYQPNAHHISYPRSRMLDSATYEGVEATLIHEMGHACHYSQMITTPGYEQVKQVAAQSFQRERTCTPGVAQQVRKSFEQFLPKQLASCVLEQLARGKQEARQMGLDICEASWYLEAYADVVFAQQLTTPFHWISRATMTIPTPDRAARYNGHLRCIPKHQLLSSWCQF